MIIISCIPSSKDNFNQHEQRRYDGNNHQMKHDRLFVLASANYHLKKYTAHTVFNPRHQLDSSNLENNTFTHKYQ